MSKTEKYTFGNLLNNDSFIAWVHSNKDDQFWSETQQKLEKSELSQMKQARKVLNKLYLLNIDTVESAKSENFIHTKFEQLLTASKKKETTVFKMNSFFKYAAAITLFLTLSIVLKFSLNSSSFDKNLTKTSYNTSDILIQTPNKTYYKITENTHKNWITESGISIEINNTDIHFSSTKEFDINKQGEYKIIVPTGKNYHVTFIDGTSVELNSNSTLSFSTSTTSEERNVNLIGEAFFDVAPNRDRPFIVQSSDLKIKVLGTAFNVSNYKENGYTSATLIEGFINASNPQGENKTITPGDQVKLFHNENTIIVSKVNTQKTTSWTTNRMIFENETLENITTKLNAWHKIAFVFKDNEIKKIKFTGTLKKTNSITHFLQMLEYTQNINYTFNNKNEVILFLNKK